VVTPSQTSNQSLETWHAFTSAHALVAGTIERDLAQAGLPPLVWFQVLSALAHADEGRLRIHELADAIVLSRSGLSRLLDRMETQSLVRRESCRLDRRGAYAVVTDEGRETLARMAPVHEQAIAAHLLAQLQEDGPALHAALERIADSARGECPAEEEE